MTARLQTNGLANLVTGWLAYASRPLYLQWGTGSGAVQSANAVTTTSTTESRTTGTSSSQTTSVTGDTYQVVGTITALGARTITEIGVFDAAGTGSPPTGGNMDIYCDHAAVGLSANDSIAYTIKVQFT